MEIFRALASLGIGALVAAQAGAQEVKEYATLGLRDLQAIVEHGGLDVVAIERGSIMVSDGKGFPAGLSMAGCDRGGACRVIRIYTRYILGESEKGMAAANMFAINFPDATLILTMVAGEPAVDIGRDASLDKGRTEGEIVGEIAAAMSDAQLLRERLMEADPYLKATLSRR